MNQQDRYEELRGELNAEAFIKAAREQTGLADFGDEDFIVPLRKLLDCVARDVDFHAQGLAYFKSEMLRCLVNRLRMEDDLRRHPDILDEDVSDPIIVLGLGRSGTTKLHKMLSAPDDAQKTYFWRMWNPARFPDAVPGRRDPRIAAADFSGLLSDDKPGLDAAHHVEQGEVEEEWMLHFFTFDNWVWSILAPTFSYYDWVMRRPALGPYRYTRKMLQYLQWQDGGKQGRPWIIKAPGHLAHLDALLDCYPNATLVHSHRDPRETLPSWSKFLLSLWQITSNPVDPLLAGREVLKSWSAAMARYLEARDRMGLDGRIVDVGYDQVRSDPMAVMKAVYQKAGRVMTPAAETKMAQWHAANEQGRFGKHEYSLEEFGFSNAMIDDAFAGYIRRFIKR